MNFQFFGNNNWYSCFQLREIIKISEKIGFQLINLLNFYEFTVKPNFAARDIAFCL